MTVVGFCAATTTAFAQQPAPLPAPPPPTPPQASDLAPPVEEPEQDANPVAGPMAEPMETPAPPAPPPEPVVVQSGVSNQNLGMLLGAGAGLGLGIGFFVAAHGDARDAEDARTAADHDRLSSRSTTLYIASAIGFGAGVALGVVALYRINVEKEHNTTVSFAPRVGGGSFVLEGSW